MGKWFYNGTVMNDGTPISVEARSDAEEKTFRAMGYRPVVKKAAARKRRRQPRAGAGRTETEGR